MAFKKVDPIAQLERELTDLTARERQLADRQAILAGEIGNPFQHRICTALDMIGHHQVADRIILDVVVRYYAARR